MFNMMVWNKGMIDTYYLMHPLELWKSWDWIGCCWVYTLTSYVVGGSGMLLDVNHCLYQVILNHEQVGDCWIYMLMNLYKSILPIYIWSLRVTPLASCYLLYIYKIWRLINIKILVFIKDDLFFKYGILYKSY